MGTAGTGDKAGGTAAGMPFKRLVDRLKPYVDRIWQRAKQERASREAKWRENLLIADGQVVNTGAVEEGKSADAWRAGDKSQTERLRVARQKVVTAKTSLGDSIFKADRVPFALSWSVSSPVPDADALETVRRRADEILFVTGVPQRMRAEIEEAASYGEAWVHGFVGKDAGGRAVGAIDVPSCWEMYFDEAGADDLAEAEYVIRERQMSAFEVARLVNGAEGIYDTAAVETALQSAKVAGVAPNQEPRQAETRTRTERIAMRECWLHVPASLLDLEAAPQASVSETATLRWTDVLVILAADEIVAVVVNPGPLPYFRTIWDFERTRGLPQGLLDVLGPTQQVLTGMVRAWLSNIRKSSQIVLAGKRASLRQDPEQLADGITFLDLDPDCRDVREALQQFAVASNDAGLVQAIEMVLQFADLESNIPRIQQGQQVAADNTAYELRARLNASGKYLSEIVRRQDGAIRWAVGWVLYIMALSGEIAHESQLSIVPRGFAQFSDMVSRLDGLLQLLGLGAQNPRIDSLLNHEKIVRQVVAAGDLDAGDVLLSAAEQQERAQGEAQSEQTQLALADAKAEVAVKQARAARDNAAAQAQAANSQLGRAKFIHDVERSAQVGAAGMPMDTNTAAMAGAVGATT
jgi:hypothetical protein